MYSVLAISTLFTILNDGRFSWCALIGATHCVEDGVMLSDRIEERSGELRRERERPNSSVEEQLIYPWTSRDQGLHGPSRPLFKEQPCESETAGLGPPKHGKS